MGAATWFWRGARQGEVFRGCEMCVWLRGGEEESGKRAGKTFNEKGGKASRIAVVCMYLWVHALVKESGQFFFFSALIPSSKNTRALYIRSTMYCPPPLPCVWYAHMYTPIITRMGLASAHTRERHR